MAAVNMALAAELSWWALIVVVVVSTSATLLSHGCVHWKLARRRAGSEPYAPPVSVLKPLKGIDDRLAENLASLARQAYPGRFELVLGTADPDDPAMDVAVELRRRFPAVTIKTVCGRAKPGLNPKVANLAGLCEVAEHDLVLVSDSNVEVGPDYLEAIVREMADPRVGLVTNVLAGSGEQSFGATLENLHLNSFVAGAVCGAEVLAGHPCVVGKSMLMRQSDLARLGSWTSVRDVLGEDYLLGLAFAQAGYEVVLSSHVIHTINEAWSVRRFIGRHLRWSQLRRWVAPVAYAFEPLLNPLPWALALLVLGWWRGAGPLAWLGSTGVIVVKAASDGLLCRRLRGRWPAVTGLFAIPIKDVVVLGLWGVAWLWRTVDWRGHKLRIGPGSRLWAIVASADELAPVAASRGDR